MYGGYGPLCMAAMAHYVWRLWPTMYDGYGPLCMAAIAHYVWWLWPTMYGGYGPLCMAAMAHYVWRLWPTMYGGYGTLCMSAMAHYVWQLWPTDSNILCCFFCDCIQINLKYCLTLCSFIYFEENIFTFYKMCATHQCRSRNELFWAVDHRTTNSRNLVVLPNFW